MSAVDALTDYIEILAASADATTRANDRPQYEARLAAAARLLILLRRDAGPAEIGAWFKQEEHRYGRGYLSGDAGDAATRAFELLQQQIL